MLQRHGAFPLRPEIDAGPVIVDTHVNPWIFPLKIVICHVHVGGT